MTYRNVGWSADRELPSGYHHDRRAVTLGVGILSWETARFALSRWQAHEGAGVAIWPPGAPLMPDTVVIATTQIGPLWVVAPCRIVYVTDTTDRFGFAYGTRPGHPEDGGEAFHVTPDVDGTVCFEIVAFSRPTALMARLGGPISRSVQQRVTRRYLASMRQAVSRNGRK